MSHHVVVFVETMMILRRSRAHTMGDAVSETLKVIEIWVTVILHLLDDLVLDGNSGL